MAEAASVRVPEVPAPEPDLTPREVIDRAQALIPKVREQQDEAERLGHHTAALDREFVEAGFYRILQPRRFGGYEFDLPTFWKAMLAVSTGDPGTGWGLTLGAHHALVVAAHFSEEGQRDIFGPDGEFRCPHRPPPMGTAEPADGGYLVTGTWDYCSGVWHATHFMGNALVTGADGKPDPHDPVALAVVIPIDQVTVLDDWGNGTILGMNSSGSNSVRAERVFVPAHRTAPGNWTRLAGPAPGALLHGNPMYCGRIYAIYHVGLVVPLIGAARAALEEFEQIITTKKTNFPPQVPRYTHPDHQRPFGHAMALADSAEALVLHVGERYMELSRQWAAGGWPELAGRGLGPGGSRPGVGGGNEYGAAPQPFSREDDVRLFTMVQQAGQLAARAVEEIFAAAGSSAAKRGQRLQRYYRDISMYRGHIAAQHLSTAAEAARVHFGLPDSLF
jgi:3-hydroxy-9,10-secoandrosta-1,3,5(10)-triene-9,17-dione monooxygenase